MTVFNSTAIENLNSSEKRSLSGREILLAAYLGIFVFSRFSAFLTMEFLNLNIYLPEVFFIPLIYFGPRSWFKLISFKRNFRLLFFGSVVFSLFILITGISNEYGIVSALGTIRGYLYVFLFFLIGTNLKQINILFVFWICAFSTFISFFWLLLYPLQEEQVYYVSLNCIFLAIAISYYLNFKILHVFLLTMTVYISVFSALRRVFLVLVLFYVILLFLYIIKKDFKFFLLIPVFLALYYSQDLILNYLEILTFNNDWLYQRIYIKMMLLVQEGGAKGDFNRIEMINNFFYNYNLNLFPRGFLTKNSNITGDGTFMDLPISEIFYTFGTPLGFLIILIILFRISYLLTFKKPINPELTSTVISFSFILIAYLFFDGGFLIWQYNTILTGLFIGLLFNSEVCKSW